MSELRAYAWSEAHKPEPASAPVRVYVWELPVRVSHWFIFLPVLVLSFTGYYMHNPFIVAKSSAPFLMATMRFTHLVAGSVFISADTASEMARGGQHGLLLQLPEKGSGAPRRPQRPGRRDLPFHVHADVDRDHHRPGSLYAGPRSMAVSGVF